MAGHSKWAKIHRQKGATDQKRGKIFSKLVRNIIIAAKDGPDPDMNFKLRLAIDKAKEANMPKDNIERAVAKGAGGGEGTEIEEVLYEGFGPEGVAFLVEATTDNRNRTASEIKSIFSKAGGSLGGPNSVQWMFERKGVVRIDQDQYADKDEMMLRLIDLGAGDVVEEDGGLTVYVPFEGFPQLKKSLEEQSIKMAYSGIDWIPKEPIEVNEAAREKVDRLSEQLEDNDDVANFYSTAD